MIFLLAFLDVFYAYRAARPQVAAYIIQHGLPIIHQGGIKAPIPAGWRERRLRASRDISQRPQVRVPPMREAASVVLFARMLPIILEAPGHASASLLNKPARHMISAQGREDMSPPVVSRNAGTAFGTAPEAGHKPILFEASA